MKKCFDKLKINIIVLLAILVMMCCPVSHDVVFADTFSNVTLNSMSIDEIAQKEKYDSRDYNIVTPNLDQGSTNICWAYATAGASETSILKDGLDSKTKDTLRFSPTQIAYRTHNRDADPLGNTDGVYASDKWNVTGSPYNTFLMLSQWCAPVAGDTTAKADAYENNLYRLLDAEQIDLYSTTDSYRIAEIKRAIAKYGAVTGSYYNAREVAYYNTKGETRDGISHAMTIVGWDDTIPASSFTPKAASQNGGWIIKNSYNSLPYFYLSYDSSIGNVCGFKYAQKSEYDFNYFYDNVSDAPMRSDGNSKCVANIFKAKKGSATHDEYIKAVNVATYGYNLTCKVEVYTNLTDPTNPESGTLTSSGERVLEYGGYHTIKLNNLAKIEKDTYYSVVVSVGSSSGGSANILYSLNASENTKYKSAYGWNSISYAARIKAYTVLQEKENTGKTEETEQKIDISTAQYDAISPITFTGQEICPQVNLKIGSQNLVKDTDYTVSYSNNVNVGTAEVSITGIGNYTGNLTLQFEILQATTPTTPDKETTEKTEETEQKIDISTAQYDAISPITFTGQEICPQVNLKIGSQNLVKDTDYTVSYSNNVNVGTAEVSITGIGNYTGNLTLQFEILQATTPTTPDKETTEKTEETEQKIDISTAQYDAISPITFTGQEICPQVSLKIGSQNLVKDTDYTVSYSNNVNVGTAEIFVTGIGNYTGNLTLQFEILQATTPTTPDSEIEIPTNAMTLADVSLPVGWQWENPDLSIENLTSAVAVFVGENKNNYNNTSMTISLQSKDLPSPDIQTEDKPNNSDDNSNDDSGDDNNADSGNVDNNVDNNNVDNNNNSQSGNSDKQKDIITEKTDRTLIIVVAGVVCAVVVAILVFAIVKARKTKNK